MITIKILLVQPFSFSFNKIIDLSHSYSKKTIYWPTEGSFKLEKEFDGFTEKGFYYAANKFCSSEHGGTHIDAPIHFGENQLTVDKINLENLISQAIVVDISKKARNNPDYQITIEDFENWESVFGNIPKESIILCNTGYGKFWPNRLQYLGTDKFGPEGIRNLHFPGLHQDTANWLIKNRNIKAIGLDTPSIDFGQSILFESHRILCANNILIFENIANMEKLPAVGSFVIALPMKIEKGSGSPLRIIALIKSKD